MTNKTKWTLPEPLSICKVQVDDNTEIAVRRHGNSAGPRLVVSHGNGLTVDLYFPFWSLFMDDFDLMIYDLRNHGWNNVGDRRKHNIPTMVADHDIVLDTIFRNFGEKTTVGIFHSLSSLVPLISSRSRYSALVLFDPPVFKPGLSESAFDSKVMEHAAMSRLRKDRFDTEKQLADVLALAPSFARLPLEIHHLMAQSLLRRTADGHGFELRCPRVFEAQIETYFRSFQPLLDLSTLRCPTKVIGGDPMLADTYLPTKDLAVATAVEYDFLPDRSHFLQLEAPEACAVKVREFLAEHGLS